MVTRCVMLLWKPVHSCDPNHLWMICVLNACKRGQGCKNVLHHQQMVRESLSAHGSTSVWIGIGTTSAICTIYEIYTTSYPHTIAIWIRYNIPQPAVRFVFFSIQWEDLYKTCAILYLIYPNFWRILKNTQNLHKIFFKMTNFFEI